MLPPDDPVLHPGDRVRIVCPEAPEVCVDRTVGPDGTVDLPDIGALGAALHRTTELAREIAAHLDGGPLPTRVDVRFLGFAPTEVQVDGAVTRSLRVYAPHGIGRDRLMSAATPTRDADLALLNAPPLLRPGTQISIRSITPDRRIEVVGSVGNPLTLPPANALVLSSALESAGGLTAHGDPNEIVVVRAGESIPVSLPADAGFLLRPGDVVRVGTIADRRYIVVRGLVARPGSVEYARDMTATRALSAAGGLLDSARQGTLVWQTGSKSFRLSIAFLLDRRIPDPALSPSDTLLVEARKP